MSVKAMAWAWEQDVPMSTKGVLLALADHADADGTCWPGVKGIAEKCRLSPRTVRYHLKVLRRMSLVIAEERRRDDGTQTSNIYHLPVNILPPTLQSLSPYPDNLDRGRVQSLSPHEPSLEPSKELSSHPYSDDPEWFKVLCEIESFNRPLLKCQFYLDAKNITMERAEQTAIKLKSKWPPSKAHKDVWATFQDWVMRPPLQQRVSSNGTAKGYSQKEPSSSERANAIRAEAERLGIDPRSAPVS